MELLEVTPEQIWETGEKGMYAVMEHAIGMFGTRKYNILAVALRLRLM